MQCAHTNEEIIRTLESYSLLLISNNWEHSIPVCKFEPQVGYLINSPAQLIIVDIVPTFNEIVSALETSGDMHRSDQLNISGGKLPSL